MTADQRSVVSRDGTPIAVFSSGDGPPLLLVHGATADHTTWRSVGPVLERAFRLHAVDRRGRGASGDGSSYEIEREYEDLAAVAEAVADEEGTPVDVVGHSYGGRCALGAALLTESIRRLIVYEGAPSPSAADGDPGMGYRPVGVERRIAGLIEAGDRDARSGDVHAGDRPDAGRPTSPRFALTRSGRFEPRPSGPRCGSSRARRRRPRRSTRWPVSLSRSCSCSAGRARHRFARPPRPSTRGYGTVESW